MSCNVFTKSDAKQWKVLSASEIREKYPANLTTVELHVKMLKEMHRSTDWLHVIVLNQSNGIAFYEAMDSAADKNVIHPSCLAMMMQEAPWSVRVVEHGWVTCEGISTEIKVGYNNTAIIRINYKGKPHLMES